MSWALVTSTSIANSSSAVTTSEVDTTGATLYIVAVGAAFGATTAPADFNHAGTALGNVYIALTDYASTGGGNNEHLRLYYCNNPITSPTLNWRNTNSYPTLIGAAFTGNLTTADPLDVATGRNNWSGTSPQTVGPITPANDGSLIFTAFIASASRVSSSISSPLTQIEPIAAAAGNWNAAAAWYEQPTAAPITPTWTYASNSYGTPVLAAFKPAPPPPGSGNTLSLSVGHHLRPRVWAPGRSR